MLELFKSNTELLEQKSDINMRNEQNKIKSLIDAAMNECINGTLVNRNSIPPAPTPFEQFISICENQFTQLDKANRTFKQMVSTQKRKLSGPMFIVLVFQLMNRTEMMEQFVSNIEDRVKSFQKEIIEKLRTHRLTLQETYKANEEITDKMEAIHSHLRMILTKVRENDTQLSSAMNPSLGNTQQLIQSSTNELIIVMKSHAAMINGRKPNFERENFANDCKATMAAIVKLIKESDAQEKRTQEATTLFNEIALKAASDHLDTIATNISETCSAVAKNEITINLLNDLECGNARNSSENDEKRTMVQDMVKASEKFTREIDSGISSCVKDVKYFSHIDFSQYPAGRGDIYLM